MGLMEIKQALQNDEKFRNLFQEYAHDINQFLKDPSCSCNGPLYKKISKHVDRLKSYEDSGGPPVKIIARPPEQFKVINCKVAELEEKLRPVRHGAVQIALSRYEDEVTVILRYA